MRKSFVTKDKENTRYWFFSVWKILPPDVWSSEGCFVQIPAPLGPNCVEMLHPSVRCDQVPVGCRGKELLKLRSDGRFLNHFVLLELLLLHRRVCLYGLLQYLCYSCWVRGGVGNRSCYNKPTLCQHTKLMHTYYCTCVTTRTRSECNIPINCRCLMCVRVLQYTRALWHMKYDPVSWILQESDAAKKEKEEKEKAIEEEKEEVKHEDNEWGGCLTRAFCFSMKVNVWVFDLLP